MLYMVHYNQVLVYLVDPMINSLLLFAQSSVFTWALFRF
jgi:hypothetical protein